MFAESGRGGRGSGCLSRTEEVHRTTELCLHAGHTHQPGHCSPQDCPQPTTTPSLPTPPSVPLALFILLNTSANIKHHHSIPVSLAAPLLPPTPTFTVRTQHCPPRPSSPSPPGRGSSPGSLPVSSSPGRLMGRGPSATAGSPSGFPWGPSPCLSGC